MSSPQSSATSHLTLVQKPKTTTLFEESDAALLFSKPDSPPSESQKRIELQEQQERTEKLKKMLFDDDEDLQLDEEDEESVIDADEYETLAKERDYENYEMIVEDEEDDGFINNGDPDASAPSRPGKKMGKKRKLRSDAALNTLRMQTTEELPSSECLIMDELKFLFKTCGLDALNPGFYIETDARVKTKLVDMELNDDDDFELELVEVDADASEDEDDANDDILHEDLLDKAPVEGISTAKPAAAPKASTADDEDFDTFGDDMDINDENDPAQATSRNALFRHLVQNDEKDGADTASLASGDTNGTDASKSQKKRRGLNLGAFDDTEDQPFPLEDDESSMVDEEPETPTTNHILEKLKMLHGRGASILAMSLTASNKVSPLKDNEFDFSPSPNKKRKAQSAPVEPECTFYAEYSSEEDEEERERRFENEVRHKLREQRMRKEKNPSPLNLKSASTSLQQQTTSTLDKVTLARKRKRVAEEAFAKRKELAEKFSRKYKKQKTSSATASKVSSATGGFFSSFQKKDTSSMQQESVTTAAKRS